MSPTTSKAIGVRLASSESLEFSKARRTSVLSTARMSVAKVSSTKTLSLCTHVTCGCPKSCAKQFRKRNDESEKARQ